jgi:hypothetical protein
MNTRSIAGVTTITDSQLLPFLPQGNLTANSNVSTPITAYNNNHQLLLRASPVPLIDTFAVQPETIGTCSILCSETGGGQQWLGTSCGEVYVYDAGSSNWKLIFQLYGNSSEIRSLYYAGGSDRLYIGGSFNDCLLPSASATLYNNVCYLPSASTTFSQTTPTAIVWSGATQAGFNGAVNAIESDNTYMWFGGDFTYDADNLILVNYFSIFDPTGGSLVPLNTASGDGFNGSVNNLNRLGSYVCVTGSFSGVTSTAPTPPQTFYYSPYCVTLLIVAGSAVASVGIFDNGSGTLAYPITGYDLITNNGSAFLVGAGQNSYGGADFFFQVDINCIPSPVLTTNLTSQIYSFIYTGGVVYAVSSGGYYTDGALTATIPFSPYLFLANWNSTQYFNNQGVGTQWAFNGSGANTFALSGGRTIKYVGNTYTGGVLCPVPQDGYNLLLNWNGTNYIVVGTPQSTGAWSYF